MWNEMTPELRLANQEIFIAYHDRVAKSKSEELDMDDMAINDITTTTAIQEKIIRFSCSRGGEILSPTNNRTLRDSTRADDAAEMNSSPPLLLFFIFHPKKNPLS